MSKKKEPTFEDYLKAIEDVFAGYTKTLSQIGDAIIRGMKRSADSSWEAPEPCKAPTPKALFILKDGTWFDAEDCITDFEYKRDGLFRFHGIDFTMLAPGVYSEQNA